MKTFRMVFINHWYSEMLPWFALLWIIFLFFVLGAKWDFSVWRLVHVGSENVSCISVLISFSCNFTAFFFWNSYQSENHLDPVFINQRQDFKPHKQSSLLMTGQCVERVPGQAEEAGAGARGRQAADREQSQRAFQTLICRSQGWRWAFTETCTNEHIFFYHNNSED